MKIVLLFLFSFFFVGCGVDAEKTDPANDLLNRRNFSPLVTQTITLDDYSFELLDVKDIEIDNNIRSTTLLIYPNANDLTEFEFNSPTLQAWEGVKEILPYGDSVIPFIPKSMSSFDKASEIIFTIISAGQARDDAYVAMKKAEQQLNFHLKERDELLKETEVKLDFFSDLWEVSECYYQKRPKKGEKFICKLEKDDDFKRRKRIRDCDDIVEIEFLNLSASELSLTENIQLGCETALQEEDNIKNGPIKQLIEEQQAIITKNSQYRDDGKQVVIDLLEGTLEKINSNVFLTTGAENEKPNDTGPYSIIKFSPDKNTIQQLSLRLDLGRNYSEGAGFKEYSLANGRITDLLYYRKSDLEKALEFKINTNDFVIEAELYESIQPYHGLRYVGDLLVRYPDGTTREGVGKIEVALK